MKKIYAKRETRSDNVKLNSANNQKSWVLVPTDLWIYILSLNMLMELKQLCLYYNRETWSASQTPQSPPISANTVESLTVMSVNPSETKGSPYMGHKFLCTLAFRNNHHFFTREQMPCPPPQVIWTINIDTELQICKVHWLGKWCLLWCSGFRIYNFIAIKFFFLILIWIQQW